MATLLPGKYQLKTLHEEIDLFDRKLAHLLRYEEFASDTDRNAAARSLVTKREQLARAARQMVSEGVEYNDADLPRSFRTSPPSIEADAQIPVPAREAQAETRAIGAAKRHPSPYAGTSLDVQKELLEYKRKRKKG
jgi:hypothetical protein